MKLDELKRIVNSFPDYMDDDNVRVEMNSISYSNFLFNLPDDTFEAPILSIEKTCDPSILIKI